MFSTGKFSQIKRTRISFRSFVIFIAGIYFFVMYIFHIDLNVDKSHQEYQRRHYDQELATLEEEKNEDHQRRPLELRFQLKQLRQGGQQKVSVWMQNENQPPGGSMQGKNDIKDVDKGVKSDDEEIYFQPNNRLDEAYNNLSVLERQETDVQISDNTHRLSNIPPGCADLRPADHDSFIPIGSGIYLYSAYWDSRPNDFDNRKNGSYVRIMAILYNKAKPPLQCVFPTALKEADAKNGGDSVRTSVYYYEMCENHNRAHGGYILSCPVPDHILTPLCTVRVAYQSKVVTLGVQTLQPLPNRRKFTVCVPPLFGNISMSRLAEFIELSTVLGAEHFMFYVYSIPNEVRTLLEKYAQNTQRVSLVKWDLDSSIDKTIWYHGQLISIQDCLYRNMAVSKFVAFNDIDEYIVPHSVTYWIDLVKNLDKPQRCAFQFQSAFFDPRSSNMSIVNEVGLTLPSIVVQKRNSILNRMRSKCMVKPYEIFEKGIHHVSKPIWATLEVHQVDPAVSHLHHYRACTTGMGMTCHGITEDTCMMRYKHQLVNSLLVNRKRVLKL